MFHTLLIMALVAGPDESPDKLRRDLKMLEGRIESVSALGRLNLTNDQLTEILPRIREAHKAFEAYRDAMEPMLEDQIKAFRAFREADMKNVGFARKVEGAAGEADHKGKEIRKRFFDRVHALEVEVEALLTRDQLAAVGAVKPEPKGRAAEVQKQLHDIHAAEYGEIGVLGKFLVAPWSFNLVAAKLGLDERLPELPISFDAETEVRRLREEINLLNLTNGLNLSVAQMEAIALAAPGEEKVENVAEIRASMEDLSARLEKGESPIKLLAQCRKLHRGLKSTRRECDVEPVLAVLTDAQKEVIRTYKPCLVPPKNLKDPVRVGQANDGARAVKLMERFRKIPAAKWQDDREAVVETTLAEVEKHQGRFPDEERAEAIAKLGALVDKVRAMDDVTFASEKDALVKEAEWFDRKTRLEDEMDGIIDAKPESIVAQKVRGNLLTPAAGPVMQERLAMLRDMPEPKATNVDSGPVAPNCDDGCSLDGKKGSKP